MYLNTIPLWWLVKGIQLRKPSAKCSTEKKIKEEMSIYRVRSISSHIVDDSIIESPMINLVSAIVSIGVKERRFLILLRDLTLRRLFISTPTQMALSVLWTLPKQWLFPGGPGVGGREWYLRLCTTCPSADDNHLIDLRSFDTGSIYDGFWHDMTDRIHEVRH